MRHVVATLAMAPDGSRRKTVRVQAATVLIMRNTSGQRRPSRWAMPSPSQPAAESHGDRKTRLTMT